MNSKELRSLQEAYMEVVENQQQLDEAKSDAGLTPLDLFDIVIDHLLDEGYADSEESAIAIMDNMSEEWRQSIVEADMSAANLNSPGHIDRSNEGLSARQIRMKNFADKRAQMLMRKGRV
jgi:hypothetical protein